MVPVLAFALCILVLFTAQHLTRTLDYHAVVKSLRQLPPGLLVRSLLATAVSYLALVGRDAVALRYIGAKVRTHCYGSAPWPVLRSEMPRGGGAPWNSLSAARRGWRTRKLGMRVCTTSMSFW